MSTKENYFKIGIFVITTVAILVAGIIILSAGALVRDDICMETYIDESVLGLNVGSPVMQRGVEIGRIEKITFVTNEYLIAEADRYKYDKYVMVIMAIDRAKFPKVVTEEHGKEDLQKLIDEGFRIKMAYQGITGVAYLEADYVDPQRFIPMEIIWEPKNYYIPSTKSILTSFTHSVDILFQKLDHIDFEGLSESIDVALTSITNAIKEARIKETREDVKELITDLKKTNTLVLGLLDESKKKENAANIPEILNQFNKTLKRMDQFVAGQESEIEDIITNLRQASENLRELTDNAKRNPSQIIFGSPPPESEVVK